MLGLFIDDTNAELIAATVQSREFRYQRANEIVERLNHLGVEVFDSEQVTTASARIKAQGLPHRLVKDERCCWAEKQTVYSEDPEGLMWEFYEVTGDIEAPTEELAAAPAKEPVATTSCC